MDIAVDLPAVRRWRTSSALMGVFLVLSGILDVVVGILLMYEYRGDDVMNSDPAEERPPPGSGDAIRRPQVWIVGLPALFCGAFILIIFVRFTRLWIITWVLMTLVSNIALFAYIMTRNALSPEKFGVSLNIFGDCMPFGGSECICQWAEGKFSGVLRYSCQTVQRMTVLYLVLVSTFTLALSVEMIAALLSVCYTICLPRCLSKEDDDTACRSAYSSYTSFVAADSSYTRVSTETSLFNMANQQSTMPEIPEVSSDHEHNLAAT